MSRREIEEKILGWIGEGAGAARDDARFQELALALFAYQYEHCAPYQRLCRAFGVEPSRISRWQDIPPVPSGAFKEARLACFAPGDEVLTFRSSGTTNQPRGELHLDTAELYEASLLASFGAYMLPDRPRMRFAVLAPSAEDAADSSLSYMFKVVCRERGTADSRCYVDTKGWDPDGLITDLGSTSEPVAVLGTAFAFVHLVDELERRGLCIELPLLSRIMETGGFKGRSRELTRDELHDRISQALVVPRARIVNQYGMCEMGSQFYESSLIEGRPTRCKRVPPWVRTRVIDPRTHSDVPRGKHGVLVHYDLANTGSVMAIQTSDEGRWLGDGFEVIRRLPNAEERGCSIAADTLMGP